MKFKLIKVASILLCISFVAWCSQQKTSFSAYEKVDSFSQTPSAKNKLANEAAQLKKQSAEFEQNEAQKEAVRNSGNKALLICDNPSDPSGTVAMNMARTLTQWAASNPNAFGAAMASPTYSQYCSMANGEEIRSDIASSGQIVINGGDSVYACAQYNSSAVCFTTTLQVWLRNH